ncbi:hypothetical protein [Streptomyces sp. TLI_105]|uniref:hypothetical protein n=1 Tax=Streptomyces sp. TLI_105 TaxID=1881019 RepID=UPI00089A37A6|nr:hypothetical protein [Streptomyces sp. TLI_105]SED30101.1 hypothetical protein SAMN05428939_4813 [Streptomyces sp. TLI_105]
MAPAPLRPRGVRVAVTVAAATAAPLVIVAPAPAAPAPDPPTPACGTPDGGGFPLDTRIHGGPDDYPAGGPFQGWKLDLTNTTDAPCSGVHPVLVLTDRDRALRPEQIRFEFYDAGSALWRPVAFESTEDAENVGAFTGFGGFAVPAGRTLTVPVRLAFEAGTPPDEVVVNAAVVQRQGEDGDWVGESGDYRLTVGPAGPGTPTAPAATPTPDTTRTPHPSAPPAKETRPPTPSAPATRSPERPADAAPDRELAGTGRESEEYARVLVPLAAGLLLLGAVLLRAARRPRHR